MGRVYAARDPVLERRVALKLLHRRVASEELETRLLREAKAMARLSHPEVITVHDAGRFADQLFIAMEFIEGSTLRQWLARQRRHWRDVLAVFLRAGRGLARVRVTDFGLARAGALPELAGHSSPSDAAEASTVEVDLTRTGALLGTPANMAPEQHEDAPARSDVYSFSVALFEGLYGARPFVGMRPKPDERYASIEAMLATLEQAARTRAGARSPKKWLVAGAAAIALLGAASRSCRPCARASIRTAPPARSISTRPPASWR